MKLGNGKNFKIRFEIDGEWREESIHNLVVTKEDDRIVVDFQSVNLYNLASDDYKSSKIEKVTILEYTTTGALSLKIDIDLHSIKNTGWHIDHLNTQIKGKLIEYDDYLIRKPSIDFKPPKINNFIGKL